MSRRKPRHAFSEKENNDLGIAKEHDVVKLKKEIGFFGGVSLVVGTMIGSGIFVSPGYVLANINSTGGSLVIWAACGVIATLGALCYMELGLMIKQSGGCYTYIHVALGDLPAFLYSYTASIVTRPASYAMTSIALAEYALAPFYPGCNIPDTLMKMTAVACIMIVSSVNIYSVKLARNVQIVFTVAKLIAVLAVIIGGIVKMGQGCTEYLKDGFQGTQASVSSVAVACYSCLFSYDGWDQLNSITEEIENPQKNFPRIILTSVPLVTATYVLMNAAYFSVISPSDVLSSSAVAVTFADRVFGAASFLIPIAVVFSTFGSVNGTTFTSGRIIYVAGRNGHLPSVLAGISVERATPLPAILLTGVLALVMVIPPTSSFSSLLDWFSFAVWIWYAMTFLSLLVLRVRKPHWQRPYKVNILVPLTCFLFSCYIVIGPIVENPAIEYLYVICFILAGVLLYVPLVRYKLKPEFLDSVTMFLQKMFETVPPPSIDDLEPQNED